MTENPRLLVLSLTHAKKNTTTNAREAPTAASAFAAILENPSDLATVFSITSNNDPVTTYMMMLGVYVVSGLQVEKTAHVEIKCGHLR